MRNKKLGLIFLVIIALMITMSIIVLKEIGFFEKMKPLEVAGEVVSVSDTYIEFGGYTVGIDRNTYVIDSEGKRCDVRKIQVGQRILVRFAGDILETFPAQLTEVIEIEILR